MISYILNFNPMKNLGRFISIEIKIFSNPLNPVGFEDILRKEIKV